MTRVCFPGGESMICSFFLIFNLFYVEDKIEYNLVYLCNNS